MSVWKSVVLALLLTLCCGCGEDSPPAKHGSSSGPGGGKRTVSSEGVKAETPLADGAAVKNTPPRVLSVRLRDPYIHRGVDIEVLPEAEDAEGDLVNFSYRWFVNGEELEGRKESTLPGDHFERGDRVAIWVIPSDASGEGAVFHGEEFEIPNAPPVFVTTPPSRFEAEVYRYEARAEDPDGDELSYTLLQGPTGMTLDAGSGVLHWSIGASGGGVHQVQIAVEDSEGLQVIQEYSITLSSKE